MDYGKAGLLDYTNLMGINYVRPPLLKFNKKSETKNYTEYEIITYKDSLKESEPEKDTDRVFTNDIDSLISSNTYSALLFLIANNAPL